MDKTREYYQENSQAFFDSTVDADLSPHYGYIVRNIPDGGKILDLGCGSGRDTKVFLDMKYRVDAIDGSEEMCKLASEYTGIEVKCMDFREIDAKEEYDAIWACASLLHVPSEELPAILIKLRDALKPSAIMYMSFKYGDFEGERNGRYFTDLTPEIFAPILSAVDGLKLEEEWYSEDVRPDKDVKWYNVLVRKD